MILTQEQKKEIAEDPKEFLGRAYRTKEKISAKRDRVEALRELAESITVELRPEGSSESGPSKIVENTVCKIVDLQREIADEIIRLVDLERVIHAAIYQLVRDPSVQVLLELRYLNFYSWEEIAARLDYTYRWALELHGRALASLKKKAC